MAKTLEELKKEREKSTTKKVTSLADLKKSRGYVAPTYTPTYEPVKKKTVAEQYQQYADVRKAELPSNMPKASNFIQGGTIGKTTAGEKMSFAAPIPQTQAITKKKTPYDLIKANIISTYGQNALGQAQVGKGLLSLLPEPQANSPLGKLGFSPKQDVPKAEATIKSFQKELDPIQKTVAEVKGPEKYLYGAAGQLTNMATNILAPAGGLLSMGVGAAGSKGREIEQGGGSKLAQFGGGLASGSAEVASEAISLGFLQKILGGSKTVKNFISEVAKIGRAHV